MRNGVMICAAAALLAGCAHGGPQAVAQGGPLAAAKSFTITADRPAIGVEPQIGVALAAAGLKPAAAGQPADYLVDVSYADRPGKMGAYVPGDTATAPPARWLQAGARGLMSPFRKGAHTLRVEVVDAATGKEVRRVEAGQFYWRPKPDAPQRLAEAVAAVLKTP